MKIIVKLENVLVLFICLFIHFTFGYSFWIFLIFLLTPDISGLGYLINNKVGSISYNLFHTYILPLLILLIYLLVKEAIILQIALIWLSHISMDRALGYGLKYANSHKETTIQKL